MPHADLTQNAMGKESFESAAYVSSQEMLHKNQLYANRFQPFSSTNDQQSQPTPIIQVVTQARDTSNLGSTRNITQDIPPTFVGSSLTSPILQSNTPELAAHGSSITSQHNMNYHSGLNNNQPQHLNPYLQSSSATQQNPHLHDSKPSNIHPY